MNLVIVESPTKAKTLLGILGKSYKIEASMGHIRDLPKSGLGVDLANDFQPEYVVPEKAKKTITLLKKLSKDADTIYLATDPDREGEAIAWHLKILLGAKKNYQRVTFHELTKSAITEAFKKVADVDTHLVDAQQARRVLDRLVGYKLSPLLWKKVRYGLSAGRVQSVAVRLVVERERERQSFSPEEYWSITGDFQNAAHQKLTAEFTSINSEKLDIKSSDQAKELETDIKDCSFIITDVKKTERIRKPYPPFKTSTLQQAGANVFGFSAKRTMIVAQKLFEQGYITYHRTDSLNLSSQFIDNARVFIKEKLGTAFLPAEAIFYKTTAKSAQEAHEAIRPTNLTSVTNVGLTPDEAKIYSLIWKRALECQVLPAVYDQTSVSIESSKGHVFRVAGSVAKFDGWLGVGKLINLETDEEEVYKLADLAVGEGLELLKLNSEQHFTQPPARFSDAALIKTLEELGIGRPSTYAPTISTITDRGYVRKEGRYFVPEDVAYVVTDLLVEHFSEVIDYKFTADLEEDLDEIAEGTKEWIPVIREFYTPFEKDLKEKEETLQKSEVTNLGETNEKCPECGKPLIIKLGKYGKFLSCSNYPECKYARPIEDPKPGSEEAATLEDYGKCPNCEDGVFVLKRGRFGKFLACSNYPKCKTTKSFLEKIGMHCPKCSDGEVVVKKAKGRVFYGCSHYPDCDYSSWKNPMQAETKEEGI